MTTPVRPKEGDEKDCITCGHPAIFDERPLRPRQLTQIGDHIAPAAEYHSTAGWVCTVSESHFEPVE
jgi:hypothetical protein